MAKSLQDQLLKSGLVDKKKAKQVKQEKRKQAKQQPKGQMNIDESKRRAQQALAEKTESDRKGNLQRQQIAEHKAIQAQIKQLIDVNRIDRQNGEIGYQFSDQKKIKKIFVTESQQEQLARGQIAIVNLANGYELVPTIIAKKIQERDESVVVFLNQTRQQNIDEDDPYADYQIPDDLMW